MKTTRRSFLLSSLAFGSPLLLFPLKSHAATDFAEPLPPADLKKIGLDAFSDEELDLPYFVAHFHRLANSVVMDGENRGFISLPVWRSRKDNKPYNARIMENILSLAFFYVTDRPWNPYRGDPRLRARLEAALSFWCDSEQGGRLSEYSVGGYNLAATAFATKFMGETLFLLQTGRQPLDPALSDRVRATDRKLIETVLTNKKFIQFGRSYSNQYTNVFAGALAYLDQFPDTELRALLEKTIRQMSEDLQSPIGFFYEKNGPDWGYNLGTHHSNLRMCWFYTKDTELGTLFLEEEKRFIEWFSFNAVWDPNRKGYFLNRAVETRKSQDFWRGYSTNPNMNSSIFLLEATPQAAAFLPTREETARWKRETREALKKKWPSVGSLKIGDFAGFAPYQFLHRRHMSKLPDNREKETARQSLPYLNRERFTQQRQDSRTETCFTFLRRPAYYAVFNSGSKVSKQQCLGLGLLWTPKLGVILQGQRTEPGIWGTRPEKADRVAESEAFRPAFFFDGKEIALQNGIQERPDKDCRIVYRLRGGGEKTMEFLEDSIRGRIRRPGAFEETVPLLAAPNQPPRLEKTRLVFSDQGGGYRITFPDHVTASLETSKTSIGGKRLFVLSLKARDNLDYEFAFQ